MTFKLLSRSLRQSSHISSRTSHMIEICIEGTTNVTQTGHEPPVWWGNTIVGSTLDNKNKAVKIKLGDGEIFGPAPGSW